ncbi:hypothetical protein ACFFRR_007086 [Megaselia abdita]
MSTVAVSSDEAVEIEYDSDTFDDESIEEQFSKRNIEGAIAARTKVHSDNENIDSEYISYESEDEVYEFTEDELEEEDESKGKQLTYDDLNEIDNLVSTQTEIINEKVRKRLELVTPPKKQQAEKPLETPTDKKKPPSNSNPLKEVKNFNETFLQESDKLRIKAEIAEEVENNTKEKAENKPAIKEKKMQIKTVAQVHKDGYDELIPTKENILNKVNLKEKGIPQEKKELYFKEPSFKDEIKTPKSNREIKFEKTEQKNELSLKKSPQKTEQNIETKNSTRDNDSNDGDEDDDDDDDDVVIVESESSSDDGLDMEMRSHTPSSMRSSDYAYHLNFIKAQHQHGCPAHRGNCKPPIRKNMSFTNVRLREIERQNEILLKKILTQKPSYLGPMKKPSVIQKPDNPPSARKSSAEINRKKQQRQIDLDNLVLKKKIEAISRRRTK